MIFSWNSRASTTSMNNNQATAGFVQFFKSNADFLLGVDILEQLQGLIPRLQSNTPLHHFGL
jgi:hypothetical protein